MAKPTKAEITVFVVTMIARWANRSPNTLQPSDELQGNLGISARGMRTLALVLRGYVQEYAPGKTVRVSELKTAKTVSGVVNLIVKKIHTSGMTDAKLAEYISEL